MSDNNKSTLIKLVENLPEIYQPIFGHPEISTKVSRQCENRLTYIKKIYELISAKLTRPLRVLDLGSSQGYFSFELANIGAIVHGIDFLQSNIDVCNNLALEFPKLNVEFEVARVEDFVDKIEKGQYDLVLGLSIFHHIIHEQGKDKVTLIIRQLAEKISLGIFEVALAEEPLYWGLSQYNDPRELLSEYFFIHEIAKIETHLSEITRPLYVASNKYWILNDQIETFNISKNESHSLSNNIHEFTRKYFFSDKYLIKLYLINCRDNIKEANLLEYHNEINFLSLDIDLPFSLPKLILSGNNDNEVWLIREKLEGELLSDLINKKVEYNEQQILEDIFFQLSELEKKGYYHNDLRAWNVIIDSEGRANLIDYGSVNKSIQDCAWPDNIFLSSFIFIQEILEHKIINPIPFRYELYDDNNLDVRYKNILIELFLEDIDKLSFGFIYNKILNINKEKNISKNITTGSLLAIKLFQNKIYELINDHYMDSLYINQIKNDLNSKNIEFNLINSQLSLIQTELNSTKEELSSRINELSSIYSSRGWRLISLFRKYSYKLFPDEEFRKNVIAVIFGSSKRIAKIIRKIIGKIVGLFLIFKDRFLSSCNKRKRKVNFNSKKVLYVGHSYHNKTKSTTFLIDYLKKFFEVEVLSDTSWEDGKELDLSFIDDSYFAVVFFQLLPRGDVLKGIKNDNIIFFPMYDGVRQDYQFWSGLRNLKVINFSKTLHTKLRKWGLDSMHIQYFPKPDEFIPGDKNKVFFWQRLTHININTITKLFKNKEVKIHIHKALDPWQEFIKPTKKQEKDFNITSSDWFDTKEEMWDVIKENAIYIAPREYEGIGMSFLEAMAMGKAVVAVDNPTMNEYIKDGVTGYLFDLKHPKTIDLSNIEDIQKNVYEFMCNGYKKWKEKKIEIINFIKK